MATIQELQTRLDEKTFDPSALNDDQRAAGRANFIRPRTIGVEIRALFGQ